MNHHSSFRSFSLSCLLAAGSLLIGATSSFALSDSALSLVNQLKSKINTSETAPAPEAAKPSVELNSPPPVVTPVPATPEPVVKPEPAQEPDKTPARDKDKPIRQKRDHRKKEAPAIPEPTKKRSAESTAQETASSFGPGPKPAHPAREQAEPAAVAPRPETVRTSEASDMVRHIMEKLAKLKQGHQPDSLENSKTAPSRKEESAVNITSDYSAPLPLTTPKPMPAPAPVIAPTPAPATKPDISHNINRSFGELSDEELIQYAQEYVWSAEKSRKHNPPPTPPYRPKKKATDGKSDKAKASTKTNADSSAASKGNDTTTAAAAQNIKSAKTEAKTVKTGNKATAKSATSSASGKKAEKKKKGT